MEVKKGRMPEASLQPWKKRKWDLLSSSSDSNDDADELEGNEACQPLVLPQPVEGPEPPEPLPEAPATSTSRMDLLRRRAQQRVTGEQVSIVAPTQDPARQPCGDVLPGCKDNRSSSMATVDPPKVDVWD